MDWEDLKSGMKVLIKGTITDPIEYALVLDNELFIFKVESSRFSGSLSKTTRCSVELLATWEPKTPSNTNIGTDLSLFMLKDEYWDLLWQLNPAVEMTLSEVCKALGKDIKIIKEK